MRIETALNIGLNGRRLRSVGLLKPPLLSLCGKRRNPGSEMKQFAQERRTSKR